MNNATLQGVSLIHIRCFWSFAGDGQLVSAPVIVNQTVIVGSASGKVYALSAEKPALNVGRALPAIPSIRQTSRTFRNL